MSVRGGDVTAGGRRRLAVAEPIANDVQWVELLVFRLSRPIFYKFSMFCLPILPQTLEIDKRIHM